MNNFGRLKPLQSTGFALLGAALVAISYGLARFAFGLFVPAIREELSLAPDVIGVIGALPLVSFVLASLVAPTVADWLGARYAATLAGLLGAAGLSLISQAQGVWLLGAGVFACGVCTGLMMPALTAAMQAVVNRSLHGRVSSVMNAGTSVGVVVAVPTVVFLTDAWRLTYLLFAALAGIGVVASWLKLPNVSRITPSNAAPPPRITPLQWSRLFRLSLFAFAMGFVAAAYWLFAPDLVTALADASPRDTGWLWLAVGLAGLGGAVASDLADRNNPPVTHALMLVLMSASLTLLAASPDQVFVTTFSAVVFGLAYMSLTGLYLMTAIRMLPGRLSMGPVLPFLACALGQAVGSPVVGAMVGEVGYAETFAWFCMIGIVAALLSPWYPRYLDDESASPEAEPETGLQAAYDNQLLDENGDPLPPFEPPTESDEQAGELDPR